MKTDELMTNLLMGINWIDLKISKVRKNSVAQLIGKFVRNVVPKREI